MPIQLRAYRPDDDHSDSVSNGAGRQKLFTVQEIAQAYLENLTARRDAGDYSPDALIGVRNVLDRFCRLFGSQAVIDCKQHDLTRFYAANPSWVAPDTKKRVASALLACFRWAEEEELAEKCPYRRPKFLKGLSSKVRRPAEASEYVALMRFGSRPLRRALFFLRRTGCRTCEMRELTWSEVHLDGETPYIEKRKHKTLRKTGQTRKIGLDLATANFLRALYRSRRGLRAKTENVFTNCYDTPWDRHTFARHLRRTAQRIGLDDGVEDRVSAYCLRHSYVVDAIEAGVGTRQIADQVGHARTTMIDTVYGSHTRAREEHLGRVTTEILRVRRRNTPPGDAQGDGPPRAG